MAKHVIPLAKEQERRELGEVPGWYEFLFVLTLLSGRFSIDGARPTSNQAVWTRDCNLADMSLGKRGDAVRSIIRVLILMCCTGNLLGVFAQSTTTTRSGFAVVTVVSGNVAGLIATEVLRNNLTSDIEQDIVGPSPLITSASILVNVGTGTTSTTAIAIANPSMGDGGVNLLLTDRRGGVVLNATVHLGPRGQLSRFLNDLFGAQPPEFSSPLLLTLSSEIPVAVLAFNFQGANFASIPITSLSFPTPVPVQPLTPILTVPSPFPNRGIGVSPATTTTIGGNAFVFAQVAAGGDWSSDIGIGNTTDGTQIVRIDFFGSEGLHFGSVTNIVIQPRGVIVFSTDSLVTAIR